MRRFLVCTMVLVALLLGCDNSSSGPEQSNTETLSSSPKIALSSSTFAPVARSLSSYGLLREDVMDSTRETVYRILYPTPEGTLDTGFFATDECTFNKDGTFKCYERSLLKMLADA